MTYWVIARFKDGIYMAADTRVSWKITGNQGWVEWADISEKLFGVEYELLDGRSIKIGLCTSGLASNVLIDNHGVKFKFAMADIIKDFLNYLETEQVIVENSMEVLQEFDLYLGCKYSSTILPIPQSTNSISLYHYILANTCFGVGMLFDNNFSSIASWNTKISTSHDDTNYVESSFAPTCLSHHVGYHPSYVIQGQFFPMLALKNLANVDPFDWENFLANIILTAAKSGIFSFEFSQTISVDQADFLSLEPYQPNTLKIYPKESVLDAKVEASVLDLKKMLQDQRNSAEMLYLDAKACLEQIPPDFKGALTKAEKSLNQCDCCVPGDKLPINVRGLIGHAYYARGKALLLKSSSLDKQMLEQARNDFLKGQEYFNMILIYPRARGSNFEEFKKTIQVHLQKCIDMINLFPKIKLLFDQLGQGKQRGKAAYGLQKNKKFEEALAKFQKAQEDLRAVIVQCAEIPILQGIKKQAIDKNDLYSQNIQYCKNALKPKLTPKSNLSHV